MWEVKYVELAYSDGVL